MSVLKLGLVFVVYHQQNNVKNRLVFFYGKGGKRAYGLLDGM